MLKYIPFLILCCFQHSFAQSISSKTTDSTGSVLIKTTQDTLAVGEKDCIVEGFVYHTDSSTYYLFTFYLKSPNTFFLNGKDKIYIRFTDGEVYDQEVITDGDFFTDKNKARVTIPVSDYGLRQIMKKSVESIGLVTNNFRYTVPITNYYYKRFANLATYMLKLNYFEELNTKWSELTRQPLPVN